jgi:ABC-type multidrug transport system fused ATPase/permease subunit
MAWERRFQSSVDKIRTQELDQQKRHYRAEVAFSTVWQAAPILVTAVSFWHFTAIRGEYLSPAVAFTSIAVFAELKWVMSALPETIISIVKSLVSWRRIHQYLQGVEVDLPSSVKTRDPVQIGFSSATLTWPQSPRSGESGASTPSSFILQDITLKFPTKGLSLVCGKLGSGKSLLLLSLLGETELLNGHVNFPRASPDTLSNMLNVAEDEEWVKEGAVAYVPQTPWLLNASIENNILFGLPMDKARYHQTLEACALISDLNLMEDGDQSEIGERGINLSGGQKARVSLARAIYSRAAIVLLDDVLSAVDSHTAHHIYSTCLTGPLMLNRTTILVSHHLQLCVPGAGFIVTLDNGQVVFQGDSSEFASSTIMQNLLHTNNMPSDVKEEEESRSIAEETETVAAKLTPSKAPGSSRVLVEDEKRAVGTISRDTWYPYFRSYGGPFFWSLLSLSYILASLAVVGSNWWIKIWSGTPAPELRDASFYIAVFSAVSICNRYQVCLQ